MKKHEKFFLPFQKTKTKWRLRSGRSERGFQAGFSVFDTMQFFLFFIFLGSAISFKISLTWDWIPKLIFASCNWSTMCIFLSFFLSSYTTEVEDEQPLIFLYNFLSCCFSTKSNWEFKPTCLFKETFSIHPSIYLCFQISKYIQIRQVRVGSQASLGKHVRSQK